MKSLLLGKDSKLGYIQEGVFYTLNSTLSYLGNAIAFFDNTYAKNLLGAFGLFSGGQIYNSQNLLALASESDIENVKTSIFIALDSTQYKNSGKNIFFAESSFLKNNYQSIFVSYDGDTEKLKFAVGINDDGRVSNITRSLFINVDGMSENVETSVLVSKDANAQKVSYSNIFSNDGSLENTSFSIFTQNQGRVEGVSYLLGVINDGRVSETKNSLTILADGNIENSSYLAYLGDDSSLENVENSLVIDKESRIEDTKNSILVTDDIYADELNFTLGLGNFTLLKSSYSLFLSEDDTYSENSKYVFSIGYRNNFQRENQAFIALGNNIYTQNSNGVIALSSTKDRGPHIEDSERSIIANTYNKNIKNSLSFMTGSAIQNVSQSLIFGFTGFVNNVESCLTLAKNGGNLFLENSKEVISVGGNVQNVEKGLIFDGTIRDSHHIISFNNSWVSNCQYSFIASRDCSNEKLDQCLALFEDGAFTDSQKSILLLKNGEVQNLDKSVALIEGGAIANLKNSMVLLENAEIRGNVKDSILIGYYDDTMEDEAIIEEDEIHFFNGNNISEKIEMTQETEETEQTQADNLQEIDSCEALPIVITQETVEKCSWGVENAKVEGSSVTIIANTNTDYSGLIRKYSQDIIYQNLTENKTLYFKTKIDNLVIEFENKLFPLYVIPLKLSDGNEIKDGGIIIGIMRSNGTYFVSFIIGTSDNSVSYSVNQQIDYSENNSYTIEAAITDKYMGVVINRNVSRQYDNININYVSRSEGTFVSIGKTTEMLDYVASGDEQYKSNLEVSMAGLKGILSDNVISAEIPEEVRVFFGETQL